MAEDRGKPDAPPKRPEGWDEELDWGDDLAREDDPKSDAELWEELDGDEALDWDDALLEEPASADELEWEQTEVGDWDEELDWEEDAEDEGDEQLPLEQEPVVVGWSAEATLPDWGGALVPVRCSTDSATSSFSVSFHVTERAVVIAVEGVERSLPMEREHELVVRLRLVLAGQELAVPVVLHATSGEPSLELGRDALAGRFLVDPGRGTPGEH